MRTLRTTTKQIILVAVTFSLTVLLLLGLQNILLTSYAATTSIEDQITISAQANTSESLQTKLGLTSEHLWYFEYVYQTSIDGDWTNLEDLQLEMEDIVIQQLITLGELPSNAITTYHTWRAERA